VTASSELVDELGDAMADYMMDASICTALKAAMDETGIELVHAATILALEARNAALVEALGTAIGLLWDHCEGIAPRIDPLEATLAKHGGSHDSIK